MCGEKLHRPNLVHLPQISVMTNMRLVTITMLGLATLSSTSAQRSVDTASHVSGTGHVSIKAKTNHVLIFFITPKYFNWSDSQDEGGRLRTKDVGLLRFEWHGLRILLIIVLQVPSHAA